MLDCSVDKIDTLEGVWKMVDFSKKNSKKRKVVAIAICAVLVLGFVIGMLVSAL